MQKHLKKENLKNKTTKPKKLSKYKLRKRAKKLKFLSIIKNWSNHSVAVRNWKKCSVKKLKDFLKLTIHIMPNNIFCNLGYYKAKRTLKSISSGTYKIKTSKKVLRYNVKNVILLFLKKVKEDKIKFSKFIAIKLIAPVKLRKQIISLLSKFLFKKLLFKKSVLMEVVAKKAFNGCRPAKILRKKRKRFRLTK
jgi:hypothetical protein